MSAIRPAAPRVLPALTDANRAYWTGGATGRLMIPYCEACRRWSPPPAADCSACGGPATAAPVSGRARVLTWTLNAHQFHPDVPPPNLIAIVVLDEQDDLRVATNLVGCGESQVSSGLPVTVEFEDHGEVYYPVFRPLGVA
jgi:uncharacterized OB-fold protein